MKNITVRVPILNDEYYTTVVISKDKKYIRKAMDKYGYGDVDDHDMTEHMENSTGLTYRKYNANPRPLIIVMSAKTPLGVGILAHEATHAVKAIFDYIGETSTYEVYAHSVEAIVRKVMEEW